MEISKQINDLNVNTVKCANLKSVTEYSLPVSIIRFTSIYLHLQLNLKTVS